MYSGPVGGSNEILIDEIARSLGKDEFDFRMEYLESDRHRAVLEKAAHEAQWGKKLPDGVAQGIGMHDEYKSISAYVMEVDTRGKTPRMNKVTLAVDCGYCVNPSNVENQLVGQAMDGFATAFQSGLHIDNGATRESNFHNFKWSRMFDSARDQRPHPAEHDDAARRYRRGRHPGRHRGRGQRLGSCHRQAAPQLPAQRVRSLIAMPNITFTLDGNPVTVNADNDEELLWVLRDRLDVHGL